MTPLSAARSPTTGAAQCRGPGVELDGGAPPGSSRDELVGQHLGLARSLARRYANRSESLDDLVQVAMFGLVKAADRFDWERNIKFSTFATATISGELKRYFRDTRWGVHVSRGAQERYLLVRDATEWATQEIGRSPTVAEIATHAGLSEEDVLEAQEMTSAHRIASLDVPDDRHDGDGPAVQIGEMDGGFRNVDTRLALAQLTEHLPPRAQLMLRLRFVDEMTQTQIAARLGISQMQVSRALSQTLAALKAKMVMG